MLNKYTPSISMMCEITKMTLKLYCVDSSFCLNVQYLIFRRNLFLFLLAFSFGRQFIMFDRHHSLFKIFAVIVLTLNARILTNWKHFYCISYVKLILCYLMSLFIVKLLQVVLNIAELKIKGFKNCFVFYYYSNLIFLSFEIIYIQALIQWIYNVSNVGCIHVSA